MRSPFVRGWTVLQTTSASAVVGVLATFLVVVPAAPAFANPTVPGPPTGVIATAANASASVTWTAPSSNGGSAITGYTVTASPGGATATTTGALNATVTGLTNATAYTFTVTATNAVGTGPASTASAAVTPTAPTAPGAPTGVVASAGNAQAGVSWTAPASNGGSSITGYTITASPGGATATTTGAMNAIVTGLTNGTAYTFAVTATNAIGISAPSAASTAVTPTTASWALTLTVTAGATLSFAATSEYNVGGSSYYLQLFDVTTGKQVYACSTGTTCNASGYTPVTPQDSYVAVVGTNSTTYPPTTVVATSAPVLPPAWTVSLTATVGTTIALSTTSNYNVGSSKYYLQLFDVTTGKQVYACSTGTTCNASGYTPVTPQDSYVAVVGTNSMTYPPTTVVATSAPVLPPAWTVSLTATVGTTIALSATSNYNVGSSKYYLQLFDVTTGKQVYACSTGTTCNASGYTPVTPQDSYVAV